MHRAGVRLTASAMPARFFARASSEDEDKNDDRKNHVKSGDGYVHHLTYLMLFR